MNALKTPLSFRRCCGFVCAALVLFLGLPALGQYGTASPNYFPSDYDGATFTGMLSRATADEVSLTYEQGKKTLMFTGKPVSACNIRRSHSGTDRFELSSIPEGSVLTVYYRQRTVKIDGQKQKRTEILGMLLYSLDDKNIARPQQTIWCVPSDVSLVFRAFQK